MKFKHLRTSSCPACGSDEIVSESVETRTSLFSQAGMDREIRKHCNGQLWERREFICGCIVGWIPNYGRAEIMTMCPKIPELQALTNEYERLDKLGRELQAEKDALSKRRLELKQAHRKV